MTEQATGDTQPPLDATIVVICFNYGHLLAEALESALEQRAQHVVLIDDGSSDDTPAVAARYVDAINYLRKPNGGLSESRNVGLDLCTTTYVTFLDADDIMPPGHLRRLVDALEASPAAAFAYPQHEYFGDRTGRSSYAPFDPDRLKRGNYIPSCALLRSAVARNYRFDARLRHGLEDWDYWLTLAENGHHGVLVEDAALRYRVHESSMGAGVERRDWQRRRTYLRILWKHRRFVGLRPALGFAERSVRARARRSLPEA